MTDTNEFVYEVLTKTARILGAEDGPDYEGLLRSIQRPAQDGRVKELPGWRVKAMVWLIQRYEKPRAEILLTKPINKTNQKTRENE